MDDSWKNGLVEIENPFERIGKGKAVNKCRGCDDYYVFKVKKDVPVSKLDLSLRARNCLLRGGYMNLSSLSGITERDILSIKTAGKKSSDEILEYVRHLCLDNADLYGIRLVANN